MAKRYSPQWVQAARSTPVFASRMKAALAFRTTARRNVIVTKDALGYHGYLEYSGGSLASGFERCEAVGDVLHDDVMRFILRYPPEFAVYVTCAFETDSLGKVVSGAVFTEPDSKRIRYRATMNLSRSASFRAGLSAWLNKHRQPGTILRTFRFQFVSTGTKTGGRKRGKGTQKATAKTRGGASVGRRNARVQR